MKAHRILLQKKYARVIFLFAECAAIDIKTAMDLFYHSNTYYLMKNGIADMHCMSDRYLAEDLKQEFRPQLHTL